MKLNIRIITTVGVGRLTRSVINIPNNSSFNLYRLIKAEICSWAADRPLGRLDIGARHRRLYLEPGEGDDGEDNIASSSREIASLGVA